MRYYPINLDIQNRKCLVIGGGAVGTRKVITLLECGAQVMVISPVVTEKLAELANNGLIKWKKENYQSADLEEMFLVIGATDNEALNQQIHADAKRHQKLCNIADCPEACNFILPSVVDRGDLIIAISTSGKSPAFAKTLRKTLEKQFGTEYAHFLKLMGAIRKKLLAEEHAPEAHKHLFEQLITGGLLEMLKAGNKNDINRLLQEILSKEYEFESLINSED